MFPVERYLLSDTFRNTTILSLSLWQERVHKFQLLYYLFLLIIYDLDQEEPNLLFKKEKKIKNINY
jgi:hypothetical protein